MKSIELFPENALKVKELNEDQLSIFQEVQKYVFLHQKDSIKANIILSTVLDQIKQSKKPIAMPKGMKNYVMDIEKSISMKEQMALYKKQSIDKFVISGLWQTMCGYIVLLFIKELITGHYLIHFSIDLLVAIVAFYIALHHIVNQYQLVKRFHLSNKILIVLSVTFIVGLFIAIIGAQSPFDISFLILVIGYIASKRIFEKEI
jgi:hypothetical protein